MPPISPTFNIGPLIFHWYGIIIVLGALAGAYVASLEAKRRGQDPEHVWNGLTWCLIAGIVGARLYHIFSTPQGTSIGFEYYFVTHPFEPVDVFGISIPFPTALMIWNGGLGIFGAIAGGVLALVIYTRHYHLSFAMWLDIAAPGIPLGQAIGRWGNFVNQELYGPPTDLPWGIPIDANHRPHLRRVAAARCLAGGRHSRSATGVGRGDCIRGGVDCLAAPKQSRARGGGGRAGPSGIREIRRTRKMNRTGISRQDLQNLQDIF
jgi:prolipoprotein diacylglyceryl transferase